MIRRLLCIAIACWFIPLISPADEPGAEELGPEEPGIEEKWDQAKEEYFEAIETLNQVVLDRLEAMDDKARERGDIARVKRYKAEREAFDEKGEFPASVDKAEYRKQLKEVHRELRRAYKAAQIAFLKERLDADAEFLEQEYQRLLDPQKAKEAASAGATGKTVDKRKCWKCVTYNTMHTHLKGKTWQDLEPSGKVRLHYKELSRNDDYIELRCVERDYLVRVYDKRMDIHKDGRWQWLAYGSWVDAEEPAKDRE